MNKLLTKTVRKNLLLSLIMAIVFAAAVVVTAIFGVNYAATADNANTLTVTVNTFFYDSKIEEVESVCEATFDELDLHVNYEQKGEMSGDDCEIVYYFDGDVRLADAEDKLSAAFADKIANAEGWGNAFITVSSASETLQTNIPVSYFVRTAVAVAVFAVLALVYVAARYKTYMGIVTAVCALLSGVTTAAIVLVTRIPFTASMLYAIALAPLVTAVVVMLSLNRLRSNMKAENAKEKTAEELVVSSIACKELAALGVTLGGAILLTGIIATTASCWFAVVSLIALAVSLFVGTVYMVSVLVPMKEKSDEKASQKRSYVGAKKTSMQKAKEAKAEVSEEQA